MSMTIRFQSSIQANSRLPNSRLRCEPWPRIRAIGPVARVAAGRILSSGRSRHSRFISCGHISPQPIRARRKTILGFPVRRPDAIRVQPRAQIHGPESNRWLAVAAVTFVPDKAC